MASFTVTGVAEGRTISDSGALVNQVTITLRTTMGAAGSIILPLDQFNILTGSPEGKAQLQAMLGEKADSLDAPFSM